MKHFVSGPDNVIEDGDGDSSTNGGGGDPDDITNPGFQPDDDDSNCFISEEEDFPWYSVDMGQQTTIGRVMLQSGKVNGKCQFLKTSYR